MKTVVRKNWSRKASWRESETGIKPIIGILILVMLMVIAVGVVFYVSMNIVGGNDAKKEPLMLIDDYGRTVSVPRDIKKIITFGPSATEVVYSLGLGNRVVGVDDNSDYPENAKSKEKIGSFDLQYEKIYSLSPDIIIAADIISPVAISKIEEKGIPVFVLSPKSIRDVLQNIRVVGLMTGTVENASNLTASLQMRIDTVTAKLSNANITYQSVYMEYYPYWTYGPGSIGNTLILSAGGINIASNTTVLYPELNNEFIIAANPDVIVYTVGPWTTTTVDDIKNRPGWSAINAVKNDRIYTIDDNIVVRPGPRIVDALEQLAAIIHPEVFK